MKTKENIQPTLEERVINEVREFFREQSYAEALENLSMAQTEVLSMINELEECRDVEEERGLFFTRCFVQMCQDMAHLLKTLKPLATNLEQSNL